jgi:hypothetical protein
MLAQSSPHARDPCDLRERSNARDDGSSAVFAIAVIGLDAAGERGTEVSAKRSPVRREHRAGLNGPPMGGHGALGGPFMKRLAYVLLLVLPVAGCAPIQGDGVSASEEREVPAFDAVAGSLSLDVFVEVAAASAPYVRLECDENLLPHIQTRVREGTLHITTDPTVSIAPRTLCTAHVRSSRLVALAASGSGELVASGELDALAEIDSSGSGGVTVEDPITSDALSIDLSGSGPVLVARYEGATLDVAVSGSGPVELGGGSASEMHVDSSGSGDVRAPELEVEHAHVSSSGSGRIELRVSESIRASLSGSGDVVIAGDPTTRDETESGSGRVLYR